MSTETDMASQIRHLKNQRNGFKGRITYFKNIIEKKGDSITDSELQSIHNRLPTIYRKFDDIQTEIEGLDPDHFLPETRNTFEDDYGDLESSIIELKNLKLKSREQEVKLALQSNSNYTSAEQKTTQLASVKLPDVKLPSFSGEYEDWISFRNLFSELIHTSTVLSDATKLHYLLSCTSGGKAHTHISSLPVIAENYSTAWKILLEKYDNNLRLMKQHMKTILDLEQTKENSAYSLQKFIDEFWKNYRALTALKQRTQEWDLFLTCHLSRKLDIMSRSEIEKVAPLDKIQSVKDFMDILSRRVQILESVSVGQTPKPYRFQKTAPTKSQNILVSTSAICNVCKQDHSIFKCSKFSAMSIDERRALVRKMNLCVNCLNPNHGSNMCQYGSCRICRRKHHTMLHLPAQQDSIATRVAPSPQENKNWEQQPLQLSAHSSMGQMPQILLATAIVNTYDTSGNLYQCRVLLDSGSQSNFISEHFAQRLRLSRKQAGIPICGVGKTINYVQHKANIHIKSRTYNFETDICCLIIPKITNKLPSYKINMKNINIPEDVQMKLADPFFFTPDDIDMLIGAELYGEIMYGDKIIIKDLPPLQNSAFGYVISGKVSTNIHVPPIVNSFVCSIEDLSAQVKRFWELESVEESCKLTLEERESEEHFKETVTRDDNGRYTVGLPTRANLFQLGSTKYIALKRLTYLERTLARNPKLKSLYNEFMREYIDLGHMKEVPNEDEYGNTNVPCYYMPHHGVEKPSSTTTKLRVVFNASTKSTSGISLNDALKVGPTIQRDLFSILLTFRKNLCAFSADITKMYRQVQVQENQRRLQRILWRFSESEPIGTYELSTVTYGTASAAFLAIRTLKQVALDEAHDYPEASAKVISDFYVDDLLSGSSSSLEHAIQLRKDISSVISRGCFELRKWASNHPDITADIEDDKVEKLDRVTTLGISWKPHEDIIVPFNKESIKFHNVSTKRSILSTISSMYDPIGLCAPVILTAKTFMQTLWAQQEINWDDPISSSMLQGWNEFCQQLPLLSDVEIARCVLPVSENEIKEIQLHGFGDASEKGFGCCVYIRTTDNFFKTHIRLLCAKSRVSPLKRATIPRLELCAALLLAQLVQKITSSINIKFNRIFLWTDSEITLYRIKSTSTRFVTFVANRIAQIQELTAPADWHYVPSSNNPADVVSRGLFPKQLKSCELWWNGPKFLNNAELTWPEQPRALNESEIPELRRVEVSNFAVASPKVSFIEQFSDFKKLVRSLAIWLRYFNNLRCSTSRRRTDDIDALEFSKATKRLVHLAQQEMFQEDIRLLQETKQVDIRHSKLRNLKPFLDNDGIIRVGGRLRNAEHIDFDQRFPMVILGKHHLATLLVRYEHIKNLHLGPQALLNQLRQRFWIISGRNLCKHTVRQCIACFRSKPITMEQLMGDLPKLRVQPARAFLNVGVDFCGPMFVTLKLRGKAPIKTYVAIFVCFSTKAVHVELVEDLSTESFLAALRCFVARRGHPAHLFCDNATNFIGARNQLSEFYRLLKSEKHNNQVQRYCASEEIQFHFIPARSPHHGGIWEAAVKSAKGHLKRVIGASTLTMAELRVLLAQTEACLNSRPISALSSDPSDYSALTPGHFLIGAPLTALVDPNLSHLKCNRLSRWQHVQQLAQHLWRRWSQEYLSSLQERAKWNKRKHNVEIGTLVLLKEENLPPQKWILGRVAAVFPDQDGLIRVVQVKTANGEFRRAITKICPLPLEGGTTCKGYLDDVGPRLQGGRHVTD